MFKKTTFDDYTAIFADALENVEDHGKPFTDRSEGVNVGHYAGRSRELAARIAHEQMVLGAPTMRTEVEAALADALSTEDAVERLEYLSDVAGLVGLWCMAIMENYNVHAEDVLGGGDLIEGDE